MEEDTAVNEVPMPEVEVHGPVAPTEEEPSPLGAAMDDTPEPEREKPLTAEEYNMVVADLALDRAKLVLVRMQKQFDVGQIDFAIAQLDATRASVDRRRVKTMTADPEEQA